MSRSVTIAQFMLLVLFAWSMDSLAQQKPDLSGVWMPDGSRSERWPENLPYSPAGLAARQTFEANYPGATFDPGSFCVFQGMPDTMFGAGYWTELIQRPERLTIVFELSKPPRRIYTDGRVHPENLYPTKNGHSVGHWEGDTLVVETIGLLEREGPVPGSTSQRIVERFRVEQLDGAKALSVELTVHDPVILSEPITARLYYTEWPDNDLLEYECTDGPWRDYLRELARQRGAEE